MDFKDWWNKQHIFCGAGGMDAAEEAWNAAMGLTAKRCAYIVEQSKHASNSVSSATLRIQTQFREEINAVD